jgi:2-C-methyl-D-erythritol 4-phosphate cytidylyltransferase / 2-C-methyl-D-erythritol 2,4-cyclodiphosphate synthase
MSLGEPRIWAVVPAAGRGSRFTQSEFDPPKQYAALFGKTVIEWSLRAILAESSIAGVVIVLAPGDEHWPPLAAGLASSKLMVTATGGTARQDSVLSGLSYLKSHAQEHDWVLVHDAARPCLSSEDLKVLLASLAVGVAGAVLAAPVVDTIRRDLSGEVSTVDRQGLWRALTPQVFRFGALRDALHAAIQAGFTVTDEAQALERIGVSAKLIAGSPFNIKVTRAEDLKMAEQILTLSQGPRLRVGQGTDVHTFGPGDHVVLGGVRIAHTQGVVAHSDGDVIIHALCDAILGALAAGDIGQHFPDTDPRYRGADSRVFLRRVAELVKEGGWRVLNADVTVLAEAPRVGPHRAAMAKNLAADLNIAVEVVNIKATTTEKLGFVGRKEGLAAQATVLLSAV